MRLLITHGAPKLWSMFAHGPCNSISNENTHYTDDEKECFLSAHCTRGSSHTHAPQLASLKEMMLNVNIELGRYVDQAYGTNDVRYELIK